MRRRRLFISALLFLATSVGAASGVARAAPPTKKAHTAKTPRSRAKPPDASADEANATAARRFENIFRDYRIISDFGYKPPTRQVSREAFWKYPVQIPNVEFPIFYHITDPAKEMPATSGAGIAVQHMNKGRMEYLAGNFVEARSVWLSARARYGKTYPFHRRNDFFLAWTFLELALAEGKNPEVNSEVLRSHYDNAASFLSWAFVVKDPDEDRFLNQVQAKGLYNLAAIYFRYNRFSGAFGAATKGMEFLQTSGQTEFRPEFHRIIAESHIKNHTYFEAARELDTALRQDPSPDLGVNVFTRLGDIYFDLSNYELAEDSYEKAMAIDAERGQIDPWHYILRGESLFWLGRFSEAQKMFQMGLDGAGAYYERDKKKKEDEDLPFPHLAVRTYRSLAPEMQRVAHLRLADCFLARAVAAEKKDKGGEYDRLLDLARLEYFRVGQRYPNAEEAKLADVRRACIETPTYTSSDKNLRHAREMLEGIDIADLDADVKQLAATCRVISIVQRESTEAMVGEVSAFLKKYPESPAAKQFAEPIRELRAREIEPLLAEKDPYGAVAFFETHRKRLFPTVPDKVAVGIFRAYQDAFAPEKAQEFWDAFAATPDSLEKTLRQVVQAVEMAAADPASRRRAIAFSQKLKSESLELQPDEETLAFVMRIRASEYGRTQLHWVHREMKGWRTQLGVRSVCENEFPVLTEALALDPKIAPYARESVAEIMKAFFPDLLTTNAPCAGSYLDLEIELGKKAGLRDLARTYIGRGTWRTSPEFIRATWIVSELANTAKLGDEARALWKLIAEKAEDGAPEKGFAVSRLDATRTQVEGLW